MGGGTKALWSLGLIVVPFLIAVLYILFRGGSMAQRQRATMEKARSDTDSYIRSVADKSSADHIADAKALLDGGTINADEFAKLKAKALS